MDNDVQKSKNVFLNKNFRLVFLGALVSELGAILYSFAVSFYILEISDNNAFLQGLYLALCGVALLVLTPLGGVLGDRFNKAKIMFICDYIKGSLIILATIMLLLFKDQSAQIVILFATGILGNAVSGIFTPASGAIFPQIVHEDKLQQANAFFSIKSSLEGILGIILAGILYAALPITTLFFVVGACYIASGVSEMFIRYNFVPSEEHLTLKLAVMDMRDGLVYLKSKKPILALLLAILFINFFFEPITGNFIPFFIKTDLTNAPSYLFDAVLTPELWSSMFSVCIGISSLVGAVILSARSQKEKCGHATSVKICIMAVILAVLTLSYWLLVERGASISAFLIVVCGGCLLLGFVIMFINIPVSTTIMKIVDKDKLSKVNSITSIGSQGMIPIASVLAGAVLDSFGSTILLIVCSVGFAITAIIMFFSKSVKEI
ncbi:MAG: MFS transporter [Clostridiales bacterium]|nr:MFS transporter [Clostridiales bacterium]